MLEGEGDIDSLNLKAMLLLHMGRVDESLAVLSFQETGLETTKPEGNAETYRVRALAHLAAGNLAEARLETQKALELEPRWENVQFTAAVIDYFSTLSPAALPPQPVAWPEPVDWAYVRRDRESLLRLRKASDTFQSLGSASDKTHEEKQTYATWRCKPAWQMTGNVLRQQLNVAKRFCILILRTARRSFGQWRETLTLN